MSFSLLHPREQLAAIMGRIYRQELTTLTGGNLSILDENGEFCVTTHSQTNLVVDVTGPRALATTPPGDVTARALGPVTFRFDDGAELLEVPPAVVPWMGTRLPVGGGFQAVCARCSGLYLGAVAGLFAAARERAGSERTLAVALNPKDPVVVRAEWAPMATLCPSPSPAAGR